MVTGLLRGLINNLGSGERDENGIPVTGGDEFSQAGAGFAGETALGNEPTPNTDVSDNEPDVGSSSESTDPKDTDSATVSEGENSQPSSRPYSSSRDTPGDPTTPGRRGKLSNPLSPYASFSCVQTLAILTKAELADPDNTYRAAGPQFVLVRSGGVGDSKTPTSYETELGITTEYFIEDLEIESVMSPSVHTKQTNATHFRFQVIEPYSMGMFFETVANTIRQSDPERTNYMDAPFALILEFIGWNDKGEQISIPQTKRFFPISIHNIEMNVNAGGSVYDISAFAWNEQAFADEVQAISLDVKMQGRTVADFLQKGSENSPSLTYELNKQQLDLKESDNKAEADAYIIMFPNENSSDSDPYKNAIEDPVGATSVPPQIGASVKAVQENGVTLDAIENWAQDVNNINEIGNARIDSSTFSAGNPLFSLAEQTLNEDGQITQEGYTFTSEDRTITFDKGNRIQEVIEELIILSDYGQQLVTEEPDSRGRKKWFRIESEVYDIVDPENERQRGKSAKIYVYRVIPYLVHQAHFVPPNKTSPNTPVLKSDVKKEYDYIYSGKNDDIIDFQLNFNTAFYTQLAKDLSQAGQDSQIDGQNSSGFRSDQDFNASTDTSERDNQDREGSARAEYGTRPNRSVNVASTETPAQQISRYYNDVIVNGIDLITAEMEILGDPYYIADSGIGNYRAKNETIVTTADGSINYRNAEPYLLLNFITPLDINQETGVMQFPTVAGEPVRKFSGIYQIMQVTNNISANKFTQTMQLLRLRNQTGAETEDSKQVESTVNPVFGVPTSAFQRSNNEQNEGSSSVLELLRENNEADQTPASSNPSEGINVAP